MKVEIDEIIDDLDKGQLANAIAAARRELGSFNISGQPLAHGIREMRLQLEKYQGMIDDLVREIVKRPESDGPF